jgi:hypothetical protein
MASGIRIVAIAMVAAAACGVAASGCSAPPPAAPVASDHLEPHWQDAFDGVPELFVVVRPQRLRRDAIYGQLLNRAIEAARKQSPVVAATRALDAVDDADEIVVGLPRGPAGPVDRGDFVAVALGVRADLDPGKLVDSGGRPIWTPGETETAGGVRELIRTDAANAANATDGGASLFELPGRTWVIASGEARARARQAFAHPVNRPMLDRGGEALAMVRIDGPSLVRHAPQLATGRLGAAGKHLQSVLITLQPGEDHTVLATLFYADEDAAGLAALTLREAAAALGRAKPEGLAWLGAARVEQASGAHVVITAPLPSELVGALKSPSPSP